MGSTLTKLVYHIIFSTKGRKQFIIPEIRDELFLYIGGIVNGEGGYLIQVGGITNHIHIVMELKPTHSLSEMMKKIKGNSSKWINEQRRLQFKFAWQEGYGAFTVSKSQISMVSQYVRDQEKHHQKQSFKEELIELLKLHRVDYDEQFIWS